jgi:hypothetical protein
MEQARTGCGGYRGSLAAMTSTGSITGGCCNSSGAWAISAAATWPRGVLVDPRCRGRRRRCRTPMVQDGSRTRRWFLAPAPRVPAPSRKLVTSLRRAWGPAGHRLRFGHPTRGGDFRRARGLDRHVLRSGRQLLPARQPDVGSEEGGRMQRDRCCRWHGSSTTRYWLPRWLGAILAFRRKKFPRTGHPAATILADPSAERHDAPASSPDGDEGEWSAGLPTRDDPPRPQLWCAGPYPRPAGDLVFDCGWGWIQGGHSARNGTALALSRH